MFLLEPSVPRGKMQPTVVRNFGEPEVPPSVPIEDEDTSSHGESFDIEGDHQVPWLESSVYGSGVSRTTTIPMPTGNIWQPNGENIALTSAISQSSEATPEELISKAMSAFLPRGRFVESRTPCSTPKPSRVFISKPPAAPKKKQLPIAVRKTRSMSLLDSALQTLATLKTSLHDEARELETTLGTVPLYLEQAERLLKSPKPTLTRMSSTTRDSWPTNNLFSASPVYETKEDYFHQSGCSGSTDPLAPERLALSLKRQAHRQSTQNLPATCGSMDTEGSL